MRIVKYICMWALLLLPLAAGGQSTADAILADPARAGGLMYVYDYKAEPPMTPAPKGYKPFYISHYGRHGARYALDFQYDTVRAVLARGARAGMLTPRGERLQKDYEAFWHEARYREGELTGIGKDQHRTIALRMVRRFPEVFKGATRGDAISTPVPRVMMSMFSFVDALRSRDKSLQVRTEASESFSPILRPNWSPLDVKRPVEQSVMTAPYADYFRETVDIQGILSRIFTNPARAVKALGIDGVLFTRFLFDLATGMECLDRPRPVFDGLFTQADSMAVARAGWLRVFRYLAYYEGSGTLYPDFTAYTLKDIIEKADADMASGDMQLRLRFSHDSSVMPLAVWMDINGFGRVAHSPEEAFEIFPLYRMPMGGSLQLIFFRSRRDPEILVKVLWNEAEASLPIPGGPYYRWSDVKAWYGPRIGEALKKIEKFPPAD